MFLVIQRRWSGRHCYQSKKPEHRVIRNRKRMDGTKDQAFTWF